jgi:hypothetical protein
MEFELNSISVGDLCWFIAERLSPCLIVETEATHQNSLPKTETETKIDRKLAAYGQKRYLFKISLLAAKATMVVPDFSIIPFHFTTDIMPGSDPAYNRSLIKAMYIAMTWAIPSDLRVNQSDNHVSDVGDFCHDSGSEMTLDLKNDLNQDLKVLPLGNEDSDVCKDRDLARSAEPAIDLPPKPKLPKLSKIESLEVFDEAKDFKLAPIKSFLSLDVVKDADTCQNSPAYAPEPQVTITTQSLDWHKALKIISPSIKSTLYRHAKIPQNLIDPNLIKDLPPNGTINLTGYFHSMGISHQINPEIRFHEKVKVVKNPPPPPFPNLIPPTKARIGAHIVKIGDWIELTNNIIQVEKIIINQGLLMMEGSDLNGKVERASLREIKSRFDPVFENPDGHRIVEECNWDLSKIQTVERTVNLSD